MTKAKLTSHGLKFQRMVFADGKMITVRKGPKWSRLAAPGMYVDVQDVDGKTVDEALITGVMLTTFNQIPKEILTFHHDLECRKCSGLFTEMEAVYPGFKETDIVTVLFFVTVPVC